MLLIDHGYVHASEVADEGEWEADVNLLTQWSRCRGDATDEMIL